MAKALDGIVVLDLTQYEAGPSCAQMLGWLGAEVIKIEPPGGEAGRRALSESPDLDAWFFLMLNGNKKSVTLDYKSPPGREVFLRLVRSVDVLVENYRATVMERAGLGYAVLAAENPRLVYAQLSGFGADGPYRDKGGLDLIAQGMGGLMHVTGEPDGPPTSVGQPICDLGTGMASPGGPAPRGSSMAGSPRARAPATGRTRRTSGSPHRTAS